MNMPNENYKVIVIGGGLVGPLCALFLSKRGYKVELYERREDPRSINFVNGKSINLAISNRGRRALNELGLEDVILRNGVPVKGRFIHQLNSNNRSILYDPKNNECLYSVSRKDLNHKLLEAAEKSPNITLYFKHKLINVDLEQGHLTFLKNDTNETLKIKGDLIVGADGAFSTLRRFMQLTPLFNYNQTYLDHGYIELPISPDSGKMMVSNHLHIWPRGQFMMIALPNQDDSWTATLFMPFTQFEQFNNSETVLNFFATVFPDAVDLIGKNQLTERCLNFKPSTLVSIKCSSFHCGENVVIIGDAAHAMVPFYGQGTNAGFEDCSILYHTLDRYNDNIPLALQKFTEVRKEDAHIICDLAMYNYVEMRDLVARPTFRIRKAFDDVLFKLFPNTWVPLYNSVTFSRMTYKQCAENRAWQDKVVKRLVVIVIVFLSILMAFIFKY